LRIDTTTSSHVRTLLAMLISLALMAVAAPVSAAQEASPGNGLANGHAKDAVIVGFEEGTSKVKRGKAAKSVDAKSARKLSPLADDTYVVKLPPGQTVEKAIAKLEKQDGVEYAEPDYLVYPAETSNDARFAELWGMHGDASTPSNQYGSGAAEAWAVGAIGDPSVYVAVLDQGVNTGHEDLATNMDVGRGWDFLSDDAGVYDGSTYQHGTHVAGTIGARGGNGLGVVGVNWRVRMISVKMLGPEGNSGLTSEVVAAIDYVTSLKNAGLNLVAINASWGYEGEPSVALHEAIQRAGDAGLLFVAAAGNEGKDIEKSQNTFYPASYDCSTTVTGDPRGWDCISRSPT
jgi:subtilisin family serine protease